MIELISAAKVGKNLETGVSLTEKVVSNQEKSPTLIGAGISVEREVIL